MTKRERYEKMAEFVRQVSGLTQDNECQLCGQGGFDENPVCFDHQPWVMPIDDAGDTIDRLISKARQLVMDLKL
jgi:hypothetical protein